MRRETAFRELLVPQAIAPFPQGGHPAGRAAGTERFPLADVVSLGLIYAAVFITGTGSALRVTAAAIVVPRLSNPPVRNGSTRRWSLGRSWGRNWRAPQRAAGCSAWPRFCLSPSTPKRWASASFCC